MYTSVVGRTFLKEYNKRNNVEYSAKEFFDQVLFNILFDHDSFMFYINNSPFDQLVKQKKTKEPKKRNETLKAFHRKIEEQKIDGSTVVGFPASEEKKYATTSGMVTDIKLPINKEESYLSWIGGAMSLGVAGGYNILFDSPEITYTTFEGWQHYRRFLNDPILEKLPAYKLTTWNGQWLAYRFFQKYYNPNFNFKDLINEKAIEITDKGMEINTVSWSKLFFSLSYNLKKDDFTAYVFSLGSTNKTVGFIPFQFHYGRRLRDTYQQLFGEDEYQIRAGEFESLFGRHIKRACELGTIGMEALRPQTLKKYFDDTKNLKLVQPKVTSRKGESLEDFEARKEKSLAKDRENIISYQTYKTWLIAMLSKNKTDISDYSRDIAQALVKYRAGARKLNRKNLLEKEFFKTNKTEMLKALEKIVSDDSVQPEIVKKMNSLRDQVHFLSREDFTYFVLLLKFDYAYAERNSQTQ